MKTHIQAADMDLRDYFAAAVVGGLMAKDALSSQDFASEDMKQWTRMKAWLAFEVADQMIEARKVDQ